MRQPPASGSPTRAIVTGVVLFAAAAASIADDTAFFASRVPPNVILSMDTSGSMKSIVEHPYFDPEAWPYTGTDGTTCDIIPDNKNDDNDGVDETMQPVDFDCGTFCRVQVKSDMTGFVTTPDPNDDNKHGYITRTFCDQTRKLWNDGAFETQTTRPTWYIHEYIEWYFSLDPAATYTNPDPDDDSTMTGQEIIDEIDSATSARDYISGDYFPVYQWTRMSAAKQVAIEVMYRTNSDCPAYGQDCGNYTDRVRFGIARFRTDSNGGFVGVAPARYEDNKTQLENFINGFDASGSTPLGETLYHLYLYHLSRGPSSERPLGVDGSRLPAYQFKLSDGQFSGTSSDWAADPWAEDCQKSFIVLITDGTPNNDRFEYDEDDDDFEDHGFLEFAGLIGDYAPDVSGELDWDPAAPAWTTSNRSKEEGSPPWESSAGGGYLDDIALFMQTADARGDIPGDQHVGVYAVGFRTSGPVNDLLVKAARNGDGLAFLASEPAQVASGLLTALRDISAKTQVFTSASVPASRGADGNNFFVSYFEPSGDSPFWAGHLKLFEFNAAGEIRDKPTAEQVANGEPGDCAISDPVANRCQSGRLRLELDGFWDAAKAIPVPADRDLYVSRLDGSGDPEMVAFDNTDLSAADLGVGAGDIASYDTAGHDTTGIDDAEELADVVIDYVRGCEFLDGTCTDRGPVRKLWDIFHSDPLVVGPPNRGLRERSYRGFVGKYKHRKRVVYAGSNGGFLHGFNAGEYDTAQLPDAYDRGDGVEEFGFMPYPARQTIAQLPKNSPRTQYYVDGSPAAGDVFLDASVSADVQDAANWHVWRTVLVGGMREGGDVIYALDVTDPPDHNSASGESNDSPVAIEYPGYLWEFPCEATACDAWRPYMGQSWSEPVITRIRATTGCDAGDTGCDVEDRWVAIFAGGYDPTGDPNLAHATDGSSDAYDARTDGSASLAGRALFAIDVSNGEVFAVKSFQHDGTTGDSADGEPEMKYALVGRPAVFDADRDGYADIVYLGDLGGNVWKWVIDAPARDPNRGGLPGEVEQPDWPFLRIFAAESCSACSPKHYRSFFTPPAGALVGANLWLAFGSGERADLDFGQAGGPDVPLATAQKNRFFVLKDTDPLERERNPANLPLTAASHLTNVTNITQSNPSTCLSTLGALGFYIEARDGEKFITDSSIFFGTVLTGSYIPPAASANQCDSGGEGFIYGFGLFCGENLLPDPDPNSSGTVQSISIGAGMPSSPRVSVGGASGGGGGGGGGGCQDRVMVLTSEGQAFSECPGGRPDSGVAVKTWRNR